MCPLASYVQMRFELADATRDGCGSRLAVAAPQPRMATRSRVQLGRHGKQDAGDPSPQTLRSTLGWDGGQGVLAFHALLKSDRIDRTYSRAQNEAINKTLGSTLNCSK